MYEQLERRVQWIFIGRGRSIELLILVQGGTSEKTGAMGAKLLVWNYRILYEVDGWMDDDAVPAQDRKQGAQRMARQPNFWSERQRSQAPSPFPWVV